MHKTRSWMRQIQRTPLKKNGFAILPYLMEQTDLFTHFSNFCLRIQRHSRAGSQSTRKKVVVLLQRPFKIKPRPITMRLNRLSVITLWPPPKKDLKSHLLFISPRLVVKGRGALGFPSAISKQINVAGCAPCQRRAICPLA